MAAITSEISIVANSAAVALTSVNWAVVNMPQWAHILVSVGVATLAGAVNRSQVTPKSELPPVSKSWEG